ncbi:MAG: leucine-rich repeat domain-containing protein [Roseburia sp.]|nr:leucine-rich repeat domain-containing protein [Roseburia sp.]
MSSDYLTPTSTCIGIYIPDSIVEIREYAFQRCDALTDIKIPDSVKTIGTGAFSGCYSLEHIELGNGLTDIGGSTFALCSSLQDIELPNSVVNMAISAFNYCYNLSTLRIPSSVLSIDSDNVFNNQFSGQRIEVAAGNPNYCSIDGILYNKSKTEIICVPAYIQGTITIPESVTSISEYAFGGRSNITGIILHKNTSISRYAFNACDELNTIYFYGNEAEFDAMSIDYEGNEAILAADLYFYSPTTPATSGNYWHYDTDGKTPVVW